MERMLKDVQTVYAPGKPEELDPQEGWEREKQHIIAPTKTVEPPAVAAQAAETPCGAGCVVM
jgi:hypothetical protein